MLKVLKMLNFSGDRRDTIFKFTGRGPGCHVLHTPHPNSLKTLTPTATTPRGHPVPGPVRGEKDFAAWRGARGSGAWVLGSGEPLPGPDGVRGAVEDDKDDKGDEDDERLRSREGQHLHCLPRALGGAHPGPAVVGAALRGERPALRCAQQSGRTPVAERSVSGARHHRVSIYGFDLVGNRL